MTAPVSFTRPTFTNNDTLTASQFNAVAASSATVRDATGADEGVIKLAGDLTGTAAAPAVAADAITTSKILDGCVTNTKTTLATFSSSLTGGIGHTRSGGDPQTKEIHSETINTVPTGSVLGFFYFSFRMGGGSVQSVGANIKFDGTTVATMTQRPLPDYAGGATNSDMVGHGVFPFVATYAGGNLLLSVETILDTGSILVNAECKVLLLAGI